MCIIIKAPRLTSSSSLYVYISVRLITYLSKGNSAVFIFVHFLNNLCCLLLADVEAAGLNKALEFLARDASISVHVERVEGLVHVEVGHALEALANGLCSDFTSEVGSEDGAELELGVGHEAVIASVKRVTMVRATTFNHAGVVGVKGEECIAKLATVEATVTSSVVTRDEKIQFFASGEDADGSESLSELSHADVATVVHIEDLERVSHIEIGLHSQLGLLSFNVILSSDEVTESID